MEPQDEPRQFQEPGKQAGERIIADVMERIENRKLAASGELLWDEHNQSYTEWSRQR